MIDLRVRRFFCDTIDCIDDIVHAEVEPIDGRLVTRTRERHAAVRQLASHGMSISAIGRELSLDRRDGTAVRSAPPRSRSR